MKSRVIHSHRERRDKHNYTQIETMERKPFDVETTEDHKPYSSVDGGGSDSVDSFEDEQKKLVYRGWKVMPFIIGNAFFFSSDNFFFSLFCFVLLCLFCRIIERFARDVFILISYLLSS